MNSKKPFRQTFGMNDSEYEESLKGNRRHRNQTQKDKDKDKLSTLLEKLEATHELDGLEKSEVRVLAKRTGVVLKPDYLDYLGLKKKGGYMKPVLAGIAILALTGFGYVSYATSANETKLALIKSKENARLASDPINANGVYTAINTLRAKSGAQALASLPALTDAANDGCNDMVSSSYFDYKNPSTGKLMNSRIIDHKGNIYFRTYVSQIANGNTDIQTATDVAKSILQTSATNVNNPIYNSTGWAVCATPGTSVMKYVVGMFAEKVDKPAVPVNNYVVPTYTPPTPIYTPPKTAHTNCTSDFLGVHCTTTSY